MSFYWRESFAEILCDHGLWECMTEDQRNAVADDIASCASVEREYTGDYLIPNPETERADKAEKALRQERAKIACVHCGGRGGWTIPVGSSHSSWEVCHKCNGEGKRQP